MLKVSFPEEESEHEHLALSHWGGRGAVRLIRADPRRRAMLLEALRQASLREVWDVEACTVVGQLYGLLHMPAFAQLRSLAEATAASADGLSSLPPSAPLPRRLVDQAVSLSCQFVADPGTVGTVIHTDLHYDNVLRSASGEWLAIDPKPLSGDPHYEVAPMLWNRFDELEGDVRNGVRRRFHTLVDAAGLAEDRARDWVVVRMLNRAAWPLLDPSVELGMSLEDWLTRAITIAKAVQD